MRHLLALVAVAETGTFSAAAEQLGYTQSAVSQQVGTLERMVGTPLFERPGGRRPVRLTAAGEMLLTHARAVLARVSSAAADLRALASGEQGELRVGTLPSIGTKVLPRLLGTFRAEWPGIEIVLRESGDCADLIHAVETGDVDVTFIEIGPLRDRAAGGPPATRRPDGVRGARECSRGGTAGGQHRRHRPPPDDRHPQRRMPADHRRRLPPGARLADLRLPFRRHTRPSRA